jgi:uncharacterized membrane protein HdeD (DUF308 family)
MVGAYENRWQLLALRAATALFTGLTLLVLPGLSIGQLALGFAAYALVDATLTFVDAMTASARKVDRAARVIHVLAGLAVSLVVVGVLDYVEPHVKRVIAVWAITVGVCEALATYSLCERVGASRAILLPGAAAALFGVGLALSSDGTLMPPLTLGLFALCYGSALGTVAWALCREEGRVASGGRMLGAYDVATRTRSRDARRATGNPLGLAWPELEVFERGDRFGVRANARGYRKQAPSVEVTNEPVTSRGAGRGKERRLRGGVRHEVFRSGAFARTNPLRPGPEASTAGASSREVALDIRARQVAFADATNRSASGATRGVAA